MAKRLGDILLSLGLIDDTALRAALDRKRQQGGGKIGEHLLAMGAVDEDGLLRGLAKQHHVPFADHTLFARIDGRLKRLVPRSKAQHYRVVPVRYLDGQLVLATSDVQNLHRRRELRDALGHKVRLVLTARAPLEHALETLYNIDSSGPQPRPTPSPGSPRSRGARSRRRPLTKGSPSRKDEAAIARELVSELPPDSGVFQLTQETLQRLRSDDANDDIDTQVRARKRAAIAAMIQEDNAETVLDDDIGARIRAELGKEPVAEGSGLWNPLPAAERYTLPPGTRTTSPPAGKAKAQRRTPDPQAASVPPPAETPDLYDDETQPPGPSPVSYARAATAADDDAVLEAKTRPPGLPMPPAAALASVPGRRGRSGPDAEPVGEVFGNYRLLRKIKTGGMAAVYEACSLGVEGIQRRVAIKRILPNLTDSDEFVAMFIDEAKITVQLNHAAIGQVFELGRVGDDYFIAMEYIHGRDLNAIFADAYEHGLKLPISLACYIVQQLCEGLDYAHRKCDVHGQSLGIVHRDVSPANVLCSFEGQVKIIDFGIAKAVSKVSLTRPGLIKGKISYMSPEQMRGQPVDRRSDLFAAGIILYEMVAGRRLFATTSDVETIRNVLKGEVPPIHRVRREVPNDLAAVIDRLLQRDPAARFAWASEVSKELQRVMIRNAYDNVRSELAAYMDGRFGGRLACEEES